MNYKVLRFACSVFLLSFFSCTTLPYNNFQQVKVGDFKSDVLELVGSPKRTLRKNGKDHWIYVFYHQNPPISKEVIFEEGQVATINDTGGSSDLEKKLLKSNSMKEYTETIERSRIESNSGD